ncbi:MULTISPECIES: WxL domain-containing protein [Enterococcus]|uniref:WxL domain-containing protein n=1 Tax=Enterococcus mundtii TaxID=53346 RepID=A0A2T5DER8_ENTMU|nr:MULTISPECIES: WxL domain-containing protein [Enterococcus]PTO36544.1 WxL domain-containing protein [Enterococcus mundtii]
MKLRTFSSAAIIAAIALGSVIPATSAFADEKDLDSVGSVRVLEDDGTEEPTGPIDPEKPDTELPIVTWPEVNPNPDRGPLMIENVTNLEFGEIMTSANRVEKHAEAVQISDGTERGNFVQWRDTRAGGTFGYELQAKLTQQFTGVESDTNVLTGSTIDFANGFMEADVRDGENENPAPTVTNNAFTLAYGDAAETVVTANEENREGKGRYIMAFGDSREETAGTSVKLSVPANTATNMALDDYEAIVTWSLVAAP